MSRILIVEDSKTIASLLKNQMKGDLGLESDIAGTYSDAVRFLENGSDYIVALLDLNLPDAEPGEIVDYVVAKNVPTVVFTGDISDDIQDFCWSKRVVDYVLKEGIQNVGYLSDIVHRLQKNPDVKVLVVDDSALARQAATRLLEVHRYQVLEAEDGVQALEVLVEHPDIALIITDYSMPNMDGFELIRSVRERYDKRMLGIIGVSANASPGLSARFIKHGANDFLNKPFSADEFYCRVTQNVEMIEYVKAIRDASHKDFLTGLRNRRFFFETAEGLYADAKRGNTTIAIAMLDIDHFKKFNDSFGHDAGDEVLRTIAGVIESRFRKSDIVARFGGEEFCVLASNMDIEKVQIVFEEICETISQYDVNLGNTVAKATVSIGVCTTLHDSLEKMIRIADEKLYQAKNSGRNQVVIDIVEAESNS